MQLRKLRTLSRISIALLIYCVLLVIPGCGDARNLQLGAFGYWVRWAAWSGPFTADSEFSVGMPGSPGGDIDRIGGREFPLGFIGSRSIESSTGVGSNLVYNLTVPFWFVLGCLSVFPLRYRYLNRRYQQRLRDGCCLSCGYDLRDSPDRCPECGQEIPQTRPEA